MDQRSERIPPHNDEAEKSVLGAVFLDKEVLFDILEFLKPGDFYSEMHQEIYKAVIELYRRSEPVDILTVSEELKRRKTLEMVGGRAYVAMLSSMVPTTKNAVQYGKIIAEKAVLRRLINAASEITENSYQEKVDSEQILDDAEKRIFEIAQTRQTKDYAELKEILWANIQQIDAASQNPDGLTGLTSGFADLDKMTAGLQKSDLIIVAARPGMGKTALMLNIAQQAAIQAKAKVLIFNLEMSREQLGQRLLSIESRVEMQKLKTGKLDRKDWEQYTVLA